MAIESTPVSDQPYRRSGRKGRLSAFGHFLRYRKGGRRLMWGIVAALALSGIGLLVFPFATDIWANRIQGGLEREFAAFTPERTRLIFEDRKLEEGDAVTRIIIPKLDVNVIVVHGVTDRALRSGVGHYPGTALPGELGNVAIAGHRTGYGEPFRHLDRMEAGDEIILETPLGRYRYEVVPEVNGQRNPWITHARDWTVVQPTVEPSLTLTTCDPPGTARDRLILRAHLVSSQTV